MLNRHKERTTDTKYLIIMNEFNVLFYGLYATLFITPILAYGLRNRFSNSNQKIIVGAITLIITILVVSNLELSIKGVASDAVILYFLYLITGIVIVKLGNFKSVILKIISGIGLIPLIFLPLISIPAFLGIALGVGDFTTNYTMVDSVGNSCRAASYGNATTSTGGYNILIHRNYWIFEYEINSAKIETTGTINLTPEKLCKLSLSKV